MNENENLNNETAENEEKPLENEAEKEVKESDKGCEAENKCEAEAKTSADKKCEKETRSDKKKSKKLEQELESQKKLLKEKQDEYDALNDRYLRTVAEYDNFRRRSAKERDGIYADAYADAMQAILPVIDNLERAAMYNDAEKVREGLDLTFRGFEDTMKKLGIAQVGEKGETFDPNLHNAVMHVEDENFGEGEIVEVFQKGYKKGDKVIRYAMVKVAN